MRQVRSGIDSKFGRQKKEKKADRYRGATGHKGPPEPRCSRGGTWTKAAVARGAVMTRYAAGGASLGAARGTPLCGVRPPNCTVLLRYY